MKLEYIRKQIDHVDRELVALLAKRMELSLRTRPYKSSTVDPGREQQVLAHAERHRFGPLAPQFVKELFTAIMTESKRLQNQNLTLVAFQGEHGAYSEIAARALQPEGAAYLPCSRFSEVFSGVEDGGFDFGVVPVENSLEGAVTEVNTLLSRTPLQVVGETVVSIDHCLLAKPGTRFEEVRTVYSHPQALGQCAAFLEAHNLEARPYYDTAGAAQLVMEEELPVAAIASPLCKDIYGLSILREHVEDDPSNKTRFLMLAREPAQSGDKCSIVFATPHEAGKLFAVLELFAQKRINLTRIASMPHREDQGNYLFFLDFEGSPADPTIAEVLGEVRTHCRDYLFLGCYPRYR